METLFQDIRYAGRVLLKSRGFTAAAVIALVLGIGANTAIFSVVNAVLLNPLPYGDPDRLVKLAETSPQFDDMSVSYLNYVDWTRAAGSFEAMAAHRNGGFNLSSADGPQRVEGRYVTAGFFHVLGIALAQGRDFTVEDDTPGSGSVAIVSHELWQRRFGGEPILGKQMTLDGKSYTVIGVLPPGFRFYSYEDVFLPYSEVDELTRTERLIRSSTRVIARLKPGVGLQQARDEMSAIAAALAEQYPEPNAGHGVMVASLYEDWVGGVRKQLVVLLIAVAFVLLIACANVANLLLARSATRQKEMAIRIALGASRWRIVRQLISESLLLSIVGGGLGLLLSMWGLDVLTSTLADGLPRVEDIKVDGRVLLFTLVISILTGIIFGLVPALQASKPDLHETIKEGGRTTGGGRQRVRNILVVSEIALALVLLAGAGLMIRTLVAVYELNPGLDPNNVVTMHLALSQYDYTEPQKVRDFYRQLNERLKTAPAIEAASVTTDMLFEDDSEAPFYVVGRPMPALEEMPMALFYAVGADYQRALKIPLMKGRFINEQDTEHSPNVVVIDENLARGLFPNEEPLGKRLRIPLTDDDMEIVGVVGHVKHVGLVEDASYKVPFQFYMPFLQIPDKFISIVASNIGLLVRTELSPKTAASEVERQILAVDKNQPVFDAKRLEDTIATSLGARRLSMLLLAIFAGLAVVLAAVGIYGVMSYAVTQRTHEIGIRMALGASTTDVLKLVVGHGMMLAIAGVVLGLGGATLSTHLLSGLLYGVKAIDLWTFAAVSAVLLGVAFVASAVPARRATKVDPMIALRYE